MDRTAWVEHLEMLHRQVHKRVLTEWNNISPVQLTFSQVNLLHHLAKRQSMKTSEAAELMCVTSGALTILCDKLAEKGLIERHRDEVDRRIVYLQLSGLGQGVLIDVKRRKQRLLERVMDGITAEDLDRMLQMYARMAANLTEMKAQGAGGVNASQEAGAGGQPGGSGEQKDEGTK